MTKHNTPIIHFPDEPTYVDARGRRGVLRYCAHCQEPFAVERYRAARGECRFCKLHCYHEHLRAVALSPEYYFWQKVQKTETCWLWTGARQVAGHGVIQISNPRHRELAHRFSWELHNGPIPDGLFVLHNCPGSDNASCVNPAHLFLGTQADNVQDAANKGRMPSGEKHWNSRLTNEQVIEIFQLRDSGLLQREVAVQFGTSPTTIGHIWRGVTWAHVTHCNSRC